MGYVPRRHTFNNLTDINYIST
eukprot:UN15479